MRLSEHLKACGLSPAQWGRRCGISRAAVEKHMLPPGHPRFRLPRARTLSIYERESGGLVTANDFLTAPDAARGVVTAPAHERNESNGARPGRSPAARAVVPSNPDARAIVPIKRKRAPMASRILAARKAAATRARQKRERDRCAP